MNHFTVKEINPTLSSLVDSVNQTNQAIIITIDDSKQAVLISVEEWNKIQETLYLLSIPKVKEDLIQGKNTPWEDCTLLEELNW